MSINDCPASIEQETKISYADAKKAVESMNLIDGFLFDSSIENEEDAKIIIGTIISVVLNKEIKDISVTSQKNFQAIDAKYHGIRMDAFVKPNDNGQLIATIFDVEMENRLADKKLLPRRFRFYDAVIDSKLLESGTDYDYLPDFVSITISSYDPFDIGDMYYEACTQLSTHPTLKYEDGITHIFLFCNGKINKPLTASHGKRLSEVLKYIVSGEKLSSSNSDINNLDTVVSKIKKRPEVTKKYMKQWDRERIIAKEAREEAALEATLEAAFQFIEFGRELGSDDEAIQANLIKRFNLKPNTIRELFEKANSKISAT